MGVMQQDVAALPPTAQAVADVIGRDLTLKLAREVRFRSLYVPFKLDEHHWISRCIGYPAARRLQSEFVGMLLPLAKCRDIAISERNRRIVDAHIKGVTKAAIASLLGISVRTVQDVVMRAEKHHETRNLSRHAESNRR
jgi:hypothetical protein